MDIYYPEEIYKLVGSSATVARMVKRGEFPAPFFIGGGAKQSKGKRWLRSDVDAWIAERARQAAADNEKNGKIGARLALEREKKK